MYSDTANGVDPDRMPQNAASDQGEYPWNKLVGLLQLIPSWKKGGVFLGLFTCWTMFCRFIDTASPSSQSIMCSSPNPKHTCACF